MIQVKDRGYAWIVMMATLLSHFILGMMTFGSISVLTYQWIDMFGITLNLAAWAPALMSGSLFLTGPIISVLNHIIGPWRLQLLGVICSTIGCLLTAFSTAFWHIIVCFSIITVIGNAMVQLPTNDIIAVYFDKYKDKIYAAIVCSMFTGMMVGPVTLEYLMRRMSYKYALLIMAGISALNLPSAFIYKDLRLCLHHSTGSNCDENNQQQRGHNSYGDESHTPELQEPSSPTNPDSNNNNSFRSVMRSHFKFLKQPSFLIVMLHFLLVCLGENTFITLAVDYTVRKGVLTSQQAALGMTISGLCMIAGSLAVTVLSHWRLDRLLVAVTSEFTLGLAILLMPLCGGMSSAYPVLIIFGFFDAVFASNVVSLVSHEFGSCDHLIAKVSYVYMAVGIGSIMGPVIAGYITTLGDSDTAIYFLGSTTIAGSSMITIYWIYSRLKERAQLPQ